MGITEDIFGTFCDPDHGKKEVKRYTLTCKSGVEVQVYNLTHHKLVVADSNAVFFFFFNYQ